jgi:hypothetical protein
MFKTILRTLSILAVAALLGWGMTWFFSSGPGQSLIAQGGSGGPDRASFNQTTTSTGTNAQTAFTPGEGGPGGDHEGGSNLQALTDIPLNLGKIGLITLLVVLVRKGLDLITHRQAQARAVQA